MEKLYLARTLLLLCVFCNIVQGSKRRYDHHKVLRVETPNEKALEYISTPNHLFDVWGIGYYSDIMVSPVNLEVVATALKLFGLNFSITVENIQTLIDLESATSNETKARNTNAKHPMTWTEYHSQDDMEKYMDYLAQTNPDLVTIEDIGASYEGRRMRVLKICKKNACGNKPAMWIDGGIHAREWISPAVATFLMKELIENKSRYNPDILDKLDWYILPVHNPDGYFYSRTVERCWRKNRYYRIDVLI